MYYIYYNAFKLYKYGYGNAMGVILAIIIAILSAKIHEQAMICIFEYLFYDIYKDTNYKKPVEEIISDIMEVPFDECDVFFRAIIFETIKNKNTNGKWISVVYFMHSFLEF